MRALLLLVVPGTLAACGGERGAAPVAPVETPSPPSSSTSPVATDPATPRKPKRVGNTCQTACFDGQRCAFTANDAWCAYACGEGGKCPEGTTCRQGSSCPACADVVMICL